jgi:hypothetical protein
MLKSNTDIPVRKNECGIHVAEIKDAVCSDTATVQKIKEQFLIDASDPHEIVEKAKTKTSCEDERCVVEKINSSYAEKRKMLEAFYVPGPSKSKEWLSNVHIDGTLKQLQRKFPHYYHIEFHMINFDRYSVKPLNKLTVEFIEDLIKRQYKCIGCVINTDTYGNSGIHWFCIYIDLTTTPWTMEYFDSGSGPIRDSLCKLYKKIKDRSVIVNVSADFNHQNSSSECGLYATWYIYARLHGIPYTEFQKNKVSDHYMYKLRKFLFV